MCKPCSTASNHHYGHEKVGNACHGISTASVLAYTIAAILYAKPGSPIFDDDWVQHGFCVIQKDVPYWNSHDLCLYFDIILVVLGLFVYRPLRGLPTKEMEFADETMLFGLLGHLGHGIVHGTIGAKYRSGEEMGGGNNSISEFDRLFTMESDAMVIVRKTFIMMGFMFGLLKGVLPKVKTGHLALLVILVSFGGLFVPDVLGFAYIQAVINVSFAYAQLTLPRAEKRTFVYAAFACLSVPISFIPWIESMACQNVASKFGGHLMYDVSIPLFLTLTYYISWRHYSEKMKDKVM